MFDTVTVVDNADIKGGGQGRKSDEGYDNFVAEVVEKVKPHLKSDSDRVICSKQIRGIVRGRKGRDGKAMKPAAAIPSLNKRLHAQGLRIANKGGEYLLATYAAQDSTDASE